MAWFGARQAGSGRNWLRPGLWILGFLLIAVSIVRVQLAELAVVNRMPGQALLFDARHARGLAGLAVALQLRGQQQEAMTLARAALKREPMNVAALRSLGFALEQTGDSNSANRILFLAGRLGWRDVALQLWLVKAYALQGKVGASLRRADALARTNHLPEVTYPLFLAAITDHQLRAALVHEMADRPFWRSIFFYRLLQLPAEQMRYFDALVTDLAKAGSPITPAERAIYLTRLVQVGHGAAAYNYWLRDQRSGSVASTLSWDGGFEHVQPPGELAAPFEWQVSSEGVGVASIVSSPRGGQQYSVSPGRDYSGTLISQTVALPPGRYKLMARVQGDARSAGLHWMIRCLPDKKELELDSGRDGPEFGSGTFNVPPEDCAAQSLAIDIASDADSGSSGDVMIDDVSIRPIG
jgi:tetratricopeptide (TPR) repeat protein